MSEQRAAAGSTRSGGPTVQQFFRSSVTLTALSFLVDDFAPPGLSVYFCDFGGCIASDVTGNLYAVGRASTTSRGNSYINMSLAPRLNLTRKLPTPRAIYSSAESQGMLRAATIGSSKSTEISPKPSRGVHENV
jgi:hypothetical protein